MELAFEPEALDLGVDEEACQVAEEGLATLEAYYTSISTEGRITRAQAQALVTDCALELPEYAPVESYTLVPSRTNYDVTLEGILQSAGQSLKDLIHRAVELLKKLLTWAIQTLRKILRHVTDTARYVKNIRAVRTANQVLKTSKVEVVSVKYQETRELEPAEQALVDAKQRYLDQYNDLSTELLTEGKNIRAARQLGVTLTKVGSVLEGKMKLMEEVFKHSQAELNLRRGASIDFQTIAERFEAPWLTKIASEADLTLDDGSTPVAFKDVYQCMFERLKGLTETHTQEVVGVENASTLITSPRMGFTQAPLPLPEETIKVMERLKAKLEVYEKETQGVYDHPDTRVAYKQAFNTLSEELHVMQIVASMSALLVKSRDTLINNTLAYELKQFDYYRTVASVSDDPEAIRSVNEAQDGIRKDIQN